MTSNRSTYAGLRSVEDLTKVLEKHQGDHFSIKIEDEGVIEMTFNRELDLEKWIEDKNLWQICDMTYLEKICDKVIYDFPNLIKQYSQGNDKILNSLMGRVMKETQGKAHPHKTRQILQQKLKHANL